MKPRIAIAVSASEVDAPDARAKYRFAIEQAGGQPELVAPPHFIASVPDLIERFDGVLLPGGADVAPALYGSREHPSVQPAPEGTDEFQLEVARAAKRAGIPLFGICRGMQVMNVAFGGTLYEDIDDQYAAPNSLRLRHSQTPDHARDETTHVVEIVAGSALAELVGTTTMATNSLHHQAVRRVPAGLRAVAATRDGIVEAVEATDARAMCIGVQWHPEELVRRDEPSRALFRGFIAGAAQRAARRAERAS
ncbi:MAG TPA: gamma-glutamyl-gamma-aminobutyrate hydrolase family protein [Candidatus Eremiobacteraceae bacterium]|nr:gamma-glutamyl-gamma-aminobutyrate hydrolase family protein [Candidatus Eremiobacteraceae bacterium]